MLGSSHHREVKVVLVAFYKFLVLQRHSTNSPAHILHAQNRSAFSTHRVETRRFFYRCVHNQTELTFRTQSWWCTTEAPLHRSTDAPLQWTITHTQIQYGIIRLNIQLHALTNGIPDGEMYHITSIMHPLLSSYVSLRSHLGTDTQIARYCLICGIVEKYVVDLSDICLFCADTARDGATNESYPHLQVSRLGMLAIGAVGRALALRVGEVRRRDDRLNQCLSLVSFVLSSLLLSFPIQSSPWHRLCK